MSGSQPLLLLLFLIAVVPPSRADDIGTTNCPYGKKDSVTGGLMQQLARSLQTDLTALEEKQKKDAACAGLPAISRDVTSLISEIATTIVPPSHFFADFTTNGKKIACTNTVDEFGDVVEAYFNHANSVLGYTANANAPAALIAASGIGGTGGLAYAKIYAECYKTRRAAYDAANAKSPGTGEQAADDAYGSCVHLGLYDKATVAAPSSVPVGSPISQTWITSCSANTPFAASKKMDELVNHYQRNEGQKKNTQEALQQAFTSVSATLEQLTSPTPQNDKCGMRPTALRFANGLVSTALGAAEVLGTPWAGLVSALVAKPLQNLIGSIGSGKHQIKEMEDALASLNFDEPDKFGNYVCQLMAVQRVGCKTYSDNEKDASSGSGAGAPCPDCDAAAPPSLAKQVDFFNGLESSIGSADEVTDLHNHLFGGGRENSFPVPGKIRSLSMYELLYGVDAPAAPDSSVAGSAHKKNYDENGISAFNIGVLAYVKKNMKPDNFELVEAMASLQGDLQTKIENFDANFKKMGTFDKATIAALKSQNAALRDQFKPIKLNVVLDEYFRLLGKDTDPRITPTMRNLTTMAAHELRTRVLASASEAHANVSAADLANLDINVKADRFRNLDGMFAAFNTFNPKTSYIHSHVLAKLARYREGNIRDIKNDLKSPENFPAQPGYFEHHLYPIFRDCVLGFQLGLEDQRGKRRFSDDYKKMCGMLRSCSGKADTIGLPFEIDADNVEFGVKSKKELRPACEVLRDFDRMVESAQLEFEKNRSLCGRKITDPDFFN